MIPREINGPNGISDLIVRLFLSRSKPIEIIAPIQKDKTMADKPWLKPKKKPRISIYFTSPKPNQTPLEIRKIKRKGKARTMPERINVGTRYKVLNIKYRREKIKKEIRKESGMIKCFRS